MLNYHVFRCLTQVQTVQRDGRYWLGEETGRSWVLLEDNISHSIQCASPGVLTSLEDCEPPLAVKYGYTRGHKTLKGLRHCLMMSRNAFLFRWAYFLYILSLRGGSGAMVDIPPWIFRISDSTHYAWVDSLWDALGQQKTNSNFIGTVLTPDVPSVRWIAAASSIGVPIWVSWRSGPHDYHKLDGSRHVKNWCPSAEQVHAARSRPPPTSPFSYFFPMGHGPYNGDKSSWAMGHTTLYNGTNAPWVMGWTTVLAPPGSWVVQWYQHPMGHGLYNGASTPQLMGCTTMAKKWENSARLREVYCVFPV